MAILGGSGNFIKSSEVSNGDIITFKNAGDWVESTRFKYDDGNPKVDFNIKVEFKGEEKQMRLNKTNREICIAAYGNDTTKWVGKTATITKERCLVGGKKYDCIELKIAGVDHTDDRESLEEASPF